MRVEACLLRATMEEIDSPKFTVNQIMLLQKLKQTGLSKAQILKGLEEMEKLEDVGLCSPGLSNTPSSVPSVSSPSSQCSGGSVTNGASQLVTSRESESHRNSTSPSSPRVKYNSTPGVAHPLTQTNPLIFGTHLQNPGQLSLLSPVGTWPNTSQAVAVATAASLFQNGFAHGHVPPVYPSLLNGRAMSRGSSVSNPGGSTIVEIDDEKVDITEELEELFRRDQASVKEDIRKFISERHISQSAIAKATKNAISQSYISQWLAQPQDISGQKKKAMYTWFISEKRRTVGMSNGLNHSQPVSYRGNEMEQDSINPLLLKSKRGARFTWPKECLAILENYYNSNSYPDECKREEIAHTCNTIIQAQKPGGIILSELDKVTTVKVYNWFANRRKDDKRRRHIETIEAAMGQQQVALSPRRNSNVSPSPSCNSNESHPEEDSAFVATDKVTTMVKREDATQLAMEMAAVNSSILALVNPHQNSTSHDEEFEDDEQDATYERSQDHKQTYHQSRAECRSFVA